MLSYKLNRRLFPFHRGAVREGSPAPMEQTVVVRPVPAGDGETRCLIQVTDVSMAVSREKALHLAKEQAEIANRSKTEFLANMSHELRTPLNAVIGFSEAMLEGMFGSLGDERYYEYAGDIHESGHHLLRLINDILDVSKIEAGVLDMHEEAVDVALAAEASVRLVRPRAEEGGIHLDNHINSELPLLHADERRLKQILLNLLSNAVKFTPRGGRVALAATLDGDGSLEVTVTDTGIGMAGHEIATALSPFGQVDSSMARKHEGAGLGLPLTRGLMTLHGGDLSVSSEKGKGTEVSLSFPATRVLVDTRET